MAEPIVVQKKDEPAEQRGDACIVETHGLFSGSNGGTVEQVPESTVQNIYVSEVNAAIYSGANANQPGSGLYQNANTNQPANGYYQNANMNQPANGYYKNANMNQPGNGYYQNTNMNQPGSGYYLPGNGSYQGGYIPPYNNNGCNPYATPRKKSYAGLIIGILIAVIVLLLVAIIALFVRIYSSLETKEITSLHKAKEDFDFDYFDYDEPKDNIKDVEPDDSYDGIIDPEINLDDEKYYTFHDSIKHDLSYEVDKEEYIYETDYDDVLIYVEYPVVKGENVPNLKQINERLEEEYAYFVDYFEEEYESYMEGEDAYFYVFVTAYVTYMDEEKMSVIFSEEVDCDYYRQVYLECVNIDMTDGVILDNEHMLDIDDDFSVDFRKRSDIQNGEIDSLTWMSDQEISGYFNSPDIIVFYIPQGMEIGFNFEEGWVTVTYHEYEKFLKKF